VKIVVHAPDLGDRSRIQDAVGGLADVLLARLPDDLVAASVGADVVVVDLERPGVLDVLADTVAVAGRVVGFGPHVAVELLQDAEAAGATALPRSRFFADIPAAVSAG
jgi:hypothetical protein